MTRRSTAPAIAAFLLLLLSHNVLPAQSVSTGGLRGVATDQQGVRIRGVLVEIESPSMIGGRRAQETDRTGSFRFTDLPPGRYTMVFTLDGFETLTREGIVVSASKTFDLEIPLTPGIGQQSATITGQPPLVDVVSSATTTTLDEEYLQNLPTGRFQPATLNLAPGIENSSAYGGGGSSANRYQLDGVDAGDPEGGTPWSFVNYNIIKEVQLIGLGAPAEYGGFTGVLFESITKSGSNEFSGLAEAYYFPPGLVASNTTDAGIAFPDLERSYDTTIQAGGPFIKDKLWYFVSAQYLFDESKLGGPTRTAESPRLFAKLSWQPDPDDMFEFWGEFDRFDITGLGGDAFTPLEATNDVNSRESIWNFSWRRVVSQDTNLSVAYSGYSGYSYLEPASGYGQQGRINGFTGEASDNSDYYHLNDRYRHQLTASLSHHSDSFLAGKHDFKYGVELERSRTRSRAGIPGNAYYLDYPGGFYYSPVSYAYVGYYTYDQKAINHRATAFVQDSWQVNDRWTIDPGVRFDFNRGSAPGDGNVFRTQPISPRIGFSYDLTGRKKTVLKAHYGRYHEGLKSNYYQWLGPHAASEQAIYAFDPTTTTFDPYNPDPNLLVSIQPQQRYKIDRDLEHPYVDQYLVAVEHELGNDFALKTELIYRRNRNFIESVSLDGDFDKVVAVGEDGRLIPLYNQNNLNDTLFITNPHGLKREYSAVILTVSKRLSRRWQMLASYLRSHTSGNIDNVDFSSSTLQGSNYGPSPFLDTPNSQFNGEGTLTNDFENELTLQGQYIIPVVDVTVSADYRYFSGQTYAAQGRASFYLIDPGGSPNDPNNLAPFNQGRVSYSLDERGSRRLDATNNLNLRAEKFFSFENGSRLGLFADVFNVFNKGEDTAVDVRYGRRFGDTVTFSPPRVARLGVRYTW